MLTSEPSEILDKAIADCRRRGPQARIRPGVPPDEDPLELLLAVAAAVESLPAIPLPPKRELDADRNAYLEQAARLPQTALALEAAASAGVFARLAQRFAQRNANRREKEPRTMLSFALKAALLLTIILSSLGGTAVLSAATLPDSPVYPVKLLLEEARLSMSRDPAFQTSLHLAFAQERAEEMAGLAAHSKPTTQNHIENYYGHWRGALQAAGELPQSELPAVMTKAQTMAGDQEALLLQAQV